MAQAAPLVASLNSALTDEQWSVVRQQDGPVLVQALVGSGKTLVLAVRAVEALERGLDPAEMLAITFTNRAAREMRDRLSTLVGSQATAAVNVTTFHGLCVRILRRDGKELAIEPDFAIWDEVDRREAIRLAATQCGRQLDDRELDRLVASIARRKQRGELPQNWRGAKDETLAVYREYEHLLATSRALDFDDLVVQTCTLFGRFPAVREAWAERCRWVEVDEFQDTSPLEYRVLKMLTAGHRNLCVFSDRQQSIYRWRGVDSQRLHADFATDFPEAVSLGLTQHFRSTSAILTAARRVLQPDPPGRSLASLPGVHLHACRDERDERDYITQRVQALHARGLPWSAIAVLAPWNTMVAGLAQALSDRGVPVATVAATEFFRRPVVKDVIAYLRLIEDPRDIVALRRIANIPERGLTPRLLSAVAEQGRASGLLLTDLLDEATHAEGDPCAYPLAVAGRDYVVLDMECTGLDRDADEPVEIALVRVAGATGRQEAYRALLRPGRPVGASVQTHGYSDAYLAQHGRPPAEVLAEVQAFIGRQPIVGHNIDAYDYPLLNRAFERHGLAPLRNRTVDTLWLAQRVCVLDRYNLERVRRQCGVAAAPDHHALSDANCTAACFRVLVGWLAATEAERRALVARVGARFRELAALFGAWLADAPALAISALLERIVQESGYLAYLSARSVDYRRELQTLEELRSLAAERFDSLPPAAGLRSFLDYVSIAKSADWTAREDDRVLVLTIHAAKGLEFEAVLLAGAHDAAFPKFSSTRAAEMAEDRRLLYVGMTRARRRLEITYPELTETSAGLTYARRASRFLDHLPRL